jgi:hypothetical protein
MLTVNVSHQSNSQNGERCITAERGGDSFRGGNITLSLTTHLRRPLHISAVDVRNSFSANEQPNPKWQSAQFIWRLAEIELGRISSCVRKS